MEKDVELTIKIKEAVLRLSDADFSALLTEAADAIKTRIADARSDFATKTAAVAGVQTLEEKGVEIGITVRF